MELVYDLDKILYNWLKNAITSSLLIKEKWIKQDSVGVCPLPRTIHNLLMIQRRKHETSH